MSNFGIHFQTLNVNEITYQNGYVDNFMKNIRNIFLYA